MRKPSIEQLYLNEPTSGTCYLIICMHEVEKSFKSQHGHCQLSATRQSLGLRNRRTVSGLPYFDVWVVNGLVTSVGCRLKGVVVYWV